MSTGLDWSESGANPFSDNAKGYYGTNVRVLSMDQPCRDKPGVDFDYISGATQIFANTMIAQLTSDYFVTAPPRGLFEY